MKELKFPGRVVAVLATVILMGWVASCNKVNSQGVRLPRRAPGLAQSVFYLSNGERLHIEAFLTPNPVFQHGEPNCEKYTATSVIFPQIRTNLKPGGNVASRHNCAFVDYDIGPGFIDGGAVSLQCRWANKPYECVMLLWDRETGAQIGGDNFKHCRWHSRPTQPIPFKGETSGKLRLHIWLFSITPGFEWAGPEECK